MKIYVSKNEKSPIKYDGHLLIPTTINEINSTIEKIIAKKKFYSNSSIKVNSSHNLNTYLFLSINTFLQIFNIF